MFLYFILELNGLNYRIGLSIQDFLHMPSNFKLDYPAEVRKRRIKTNLINSVRNSDIHKTVE